MRKNKLKAGRVSVIKNSLSQSYPAIRKIFLNLYQCQRCQSYFWQEIGFGNIYCHICINMGKVSLGEYLVYDEPQSKISNDCNKLTWEGILTNEQKRISNEIIKSYKRHNNHLVYAVTGAGKTECTFALIELALQHGDKIAYVAPRIDVCNEVYPRYKKAFAKSRIQVLHSKSEKRDDFADFTISSIHQLCHYSNVFDLIIVDEFDAYPLKNNRLLNRFIVNSAKENAVFIYLTATLEFKDKIKFFLSKTSTSFLPRRFHGRKLPEPEIILVNNKTVWDIIEKNINELIKLNRPILIFVPTVDAGYLLEDKLAAKGYQGVKFAWSGSENRELFVNDFRNGSIDILISTSILERGVTFPEVLVMVVNANHHNFTASTLVQIAGRAGRGTRKLPEHVIFLSYNLSENQIRARKIINDFNRKGGF